MKRHYYLYIDDSGSRFPDNKDLKRDDGMDNYFALGGFLVEETDKVILEEKYKVFCEKNNIDYPLHSTDIRGKRKKFAWLEKSSKDNERFLNDLENFLIDIPVIGFAVVINKDGYNERYKEKYKERWWLCKTAYHILIDRVTKYIISQDASFQVCFEEVGKKEDRAIESYHKELKNNGLPFDKVNSLKYKNLQAEDFKSRMLGDARRKKKNNLYVQIADLYLYPMIKRKYDILYRPWNVLFNNKKVIDSLISTEEIDCLGIKYSCFDNIK